MDYLGILIGFVTIMLVFSLVVTALVQVTQSWLKLRARNLLYGVQVCLRSVRHDPNGKDFELNARKILLSLNPLEERTEAAREKKLLNYDISTRWINANEFEAACHHTDLEPSQRERAKAQFEAVAPWLQERFATRMRIVSVCWAVVVAVAFQLSTPDLFRRLSTEPAFLAAVTSLAEQKIAASAQQPITPEVVTTAGERALQRLQAKHADPTLDELSGVGASEAELLFEIDLLLDEEAIVNARGIRADYVTFLEEELKRDLDAQTLVLRENLGDVAKLDLRLWPDANFFGGGSGFENFVGVLITIIFLTFGAPFWFDRLKNLVALRDLLSPITNNQTQNQENK